MAEYRPSARRLGRLTLLIVGTLLGLGGTELYFRFAEPGHVHTYPAGFFVPESDLGWALAPSFSGRFRATRPPRVPLTTNSWGFRDVEHVLAKDESAARILVIGDSFTLGPDVPLESLYPRLLEQALNQHVRSEIVSMAVGGYGTLQESIVLNRWGTKLQPRVVVLQFYANDLLDNLRPLRAAESHRGFIIDSDLSRRGGLAARWFNMHLLMNEHLWSYSTLNTLVHKRAQDKWLLDLSRAGEGDLSAREFEEFRTHLISLEAKSVELGASLVVLMIPDQNTTSELRFDRLIQRSGRRLQEFCRTQVHDRVALECQALGLLFLDLTEDFEREQALGRDLYNHYDPHLNGNGHRLVADRLFPVVARVLDETQ